MDYIQAQEMCICGMCPSFYSCGEKLAFCMPEGGSSRCIKVESGCVCPGCELQEEMHFGHEYYCIRGNEKALQGK
jgi:hypothetical protein